MVLSRELRKNQTEAEKVFWNALRNKNYFGHKFLRQHLLYYQFYGRNRFFIVDFYCGKFHLVVEIDGSVHEKQADYDKIRTEILRTQRNLKVLRFSNNEVLNKLKIFIEKHK